MSQSSHQDLEAGNDVDTGGYPNQPQSTHDPALLSSQGENDYRDGSWPLYAMYSKISLEEDNNDAKHRQKEADVILVFTGLFSAAVAALLGGTLPNLQPSSEDTSAFYLRQIYQLQNLTYSNASVASIPSTLAQPPASSPAGWVVWVNTLWLSALLISLSGATLATLEREFVSRHLSITQNKEHLPERRARIRAMLIKSPYAFFKLRRRFGLLPLLHCSFFLFLAGFTIYVFNCRLNIGRVAFVSLFGWILGFAALYTAFTVLPVLRPTELFYTPLSPIVFRAHLAFLYTIYRVGSLVASPRNLSGVARMRYHNLSLRYTEGFVEGRTKSIEKVASKPSPEIDTEVLERMLLLDNDHALEEFFDTIPGFCDSRMVHKPLNLRVTTRLQQTLDAFLNRTFSSHLVSESVRIGRLITCLNAAHSALGPSGVSQILGNFFNGHRDEALKSVEIGHSLVRWGHRSDDLVSLKVRRIVACIIARAQNRDDRWAKLVMEVFDIPDRAIRDYFAHGDSMLLAIVLHVARDVLDTGRLERGVLESLSQFGVNNTIAELRHEFCALWNEIVEKARNGTHEGARITAAQILTEIHHLFAPLHQGTDSAPIRFPAPISGDDNVLSWPWSYRSCNIAGHHPDSAANSPVTSSHTVPPPTQLSDSPNASHHPTLPSRLPLTISRGLATEKATADISGSSGIADPVRSSNSGGSSALQEAEEAGTIPHTFVSGPLPTPIPTLALCSTDSAVLPPSIDSTLIQTDHVRHSLGAPSSTSTTVPLSVTPRVATVSDQYPDARDGTTGAQCDNQDTHLSLLSEDHRQPPPGAVTGL